MGKFLDYFFLGDRFVTEYATRIYEPLYDFIESRGFSVMLANLPKIMPMAESLVKKNDVDSEIFF